MDLRTLLAASAMLLMPLAAVAVSAFTSMHPDAGCARAIPALEDPAGERYAG
jgi:hypothetical protein